MTDQRIASLARLAGLQTHWTDAYGAPQVVTVATLRALLGALGLSCETEQQCDVSEATLIGWQTDSTLPPLLSAEAGQVLRLPPQCRLHGVRYRVELENGIAREGRFAADGTQALEIEAIAEYGYHRLLLNDGRAATLAVAPPRCFGLADALALQRDAAPRCWGVGAQLYGLRRAGDGGIGDFGALGMLVAAAARQGAALVAISPVHAMFAADPYRYSPYGPSSRLFFNIAYIDAAAVCGEAALHAALAELGAQARWRELEQLELIDWPAALELKLAVLRLLYRHWADGATPQKSGFEAFCRTGGAALQAHARFEVLHAAMRAQGQGDSWRHWPAIYRDPDSAAVADFALAHADEIDFHLFLQFQAARGLATAQAAARRAGMAIGLVLDLAVGADNGGSQAWTRQAEIMSGVSVGAPPDLLNPLGQSWGLGAFSPHAMRNSGYRAYIEMLRAAFAYGGGVRIDHVLGLARLWLVPEGAAPSQGAYLDYPFDDLLRLIALESWRHRAVVIGEDLGTVPDGFKTKLSACGLLGIQVLWFQRDGLRFLAPSEWRRDAIGVSGTHDLATIAGWWCGRDIAWRARLGLLEAQQSEEQAYAWRAREREALWQALCEGGHADGTLPPADAAPLEAIFSFIGRTPAALAVLPLEDVLALVEQPNIPGTIDSHPNWRRRLPVETDRLLDADGAAARLACLARERTHRRPS